MTVTDRDYKPGEHPCAVRVERVIIVRRNIGSGLTEADPIRAVEDFYTEDGSVHLVRREFNR